MTPAQLECLDFIKAYIAEHRHSPSFEEIQAHLGLASKSGVTRVLVALEQRGRIRRQPKRARSIEIIPADPLAGVATSTMLAELRRRGVAIGEARA